jgi:RNA polymerase-associated protein CTR9
MASANRGAANGTSSNGLNATSRFSDIPVAVDVPVADLPGEAVEVHLAEHLDDPTELCQLLENEKASKSLWITIALAYAKQNQIDHALSILQSGLLALPSKDRLNLLSGVAWLQLLKSRQAPRIKPTGATGAETRLKDDYLKDVTSTINEAGRINPGFPPLLLTRGVLFLLRASLIASTKPSADGERADWLKQALKSFEDALRSSDNRNMMAMLGKARVLYMQGRYAVALEVYQKVLARMPSMTDPDPRIGIGCCLWQLGYHERASRAWNRSLELNPKAKIAHALLGIYYLRESGKHPAGSSNFDKLYKKAMSEHINKAYQIDKSFPLSCAVFASYFLLTNRYDAVEPLARNAIEKTDVNAIASDGWFLLGRKEHNLGNLETANDYYGRADAARGGPGIGRGYASAKFGQVQVNIQRGQDFEVSKSALEALSGPKNSEASTLLGVLLAEQYFVLQKTLPPFASEGSKEAKDRQYAQVLCKQAIKLLENVRKSWREIQKKDESPSYKKDETILLYLARLYEQEDPVQSFKCLDDVERLQLEKLPESDIPEPVKIEGQEGKEDADDDTTSNLMRENLPPALLNNRGCLYYYAGDQSSARVMFQIAQRACRKLSDKQRAEQELAAQGNMHEEDVDDTDIDALLTTISYNHGRTLEALGLTEEAKQEYEMLLSRHSDYAEAKARLAFIALVASPRDAGPKQMSKLYSEESSNVDVRALMGWFYHGSKKKTANIAEDAEYRQYKHTLQNHDKHDVYSLTGMGNIHLAVAREMPRNNDAEKEKRSKMYGKAYEFFDKVLQLDPKNAYAAQGIAIMLCDDKKNYSDALQILARVKDTIRDISVLTNLGHVFTELRQYPKAIENYELAKELDARGDNTNPQLLACLARAHLMKAKADRSIVAHNISLSYMKAALASQADSLHLRFNVAFIQFQIAQLVNTAKETDRTLEDVEAAISGLDAAIETFEDVAQAKTPPYPRPALEQRAAMGRNTVRKQLERARTAQAEYEHNNSEKLAGARAKRAAEVQRREAELAAQREEQERRMREVEEERAKMLAEADRRNEQARAEAAAREAMEYTDDEETGGRVKRKEKEKKSRGAKGRKRKARDDVDDFIDNDEDDDRSQRTVSRTPLSESEAENGAKEPKEDQPKKKRRRLERKGGARKEKAPAPKRTSGKFKSAEMIDSDDEDEPLITTPRSDADEDMPDADVNGHGISNGSTPAEGRPTAIDDDDDEEDVVQKPRPKQRKKQRLISNSDDEDDGDGDNADLAAAAAAAVAGSDDE